MTRGAQKGAMFGQPVLDAMAAACSIEGCPLNNAVGPDLFFGRSAKGMLLSVRMISVL
jgi:hypothetical protein